MTDAKVALVCTGRVETLALQSKTLRTALRKRPREGRVPVLSTGLSEDEVGDRIHHGGPNRAVHVFSGEAYDAFAERLQKLVPRPWVGENLCVRGYHDAIACVGDRVRVGTALLQVTMPTERCGHPGLATGIRKLRKWMIDALRTGFYLRVLEPGTVRRGDPIDVVERGDERWTIASLSEVMYRRTADADVVREVCELEDLAPEWKARVQKLHARAGNGEG
jgi:MOSC domain-containing protein YiiM